MAEIDIDVSDIIEQEDLPTAKVEKKPVVKKNPVDSFNEYNFEVKL